MKIESGWWLRGLLVAAGVAVLLSAAFAGRSPHEDSEVVRPLVETPARARPAVLPPSALEQALAVLPASLEGTEVDGELVVGADGRFVPTKDALILFDYFFAASGEEPDEVIEARIRREIDARVGAQGAADAHALLDATLAYREAARREFEIGAGDLSLERRIQRIRELRREHYGEASEALFGEEERRWDWDLERAAIFEDASIDEEERARRLSALEAEAPEGLIERREATTVAARLLRQEAELRDAGAAPGEVEAMRREKFGDEATERLTSLDQQRAEWDQRVALYRAERDRRTADLTGAERAAEIARVREESFEGPELTRIRALDRIEAGVK